MNKTPATNDATRDTTPSDLSRHGVALPDAARALGVSLRTLQRRLDRGEIGFVERDGKRFALLDGAADGRDKPRDSDATARQVVVSRDTTRDTSTRQTADVSSERVAELREEVRFLRGLVEQRDRDAAELRAALREALKAQPKQLTQGTHEGAVNGPGTHIDGAAGSNSQQGQTGAGIEADGQEWDAGELLDLCRRICG